MAAKTPLWSVGDLFKKKRPATPEKRPQANPYHAVSIIPGKSACGAAFRLAGERFLSKNAPRLPLPSCDIAHCECRFKHHNDRRAGPRRRSDQGLFTGIWQQPERRRSPGRRESDR